MNTSRFFSSLRPAAAALALLALGQPASFAADINSRNQQVWKLKYGVTDDQLADPAWLAKDSDGDGLTNEMEMAAGTNPFTSSKTISISGVARNGTTQADVQFPTELGKRYRVESTTTLTDSTSWVLQPQPTPVELVGDGTTKTLTVPFVANCFYRVRVSDIDTDGDGVSDWAERAVGLLTTSAQTVVGTNDAAYIDAQVAMPNVVTINAATPFASEDGPSAGKMTVTRNQRLFPITVTYGVGGTAVPSTDYSPLSGSVTLAAGESTKDVFVNPMNRAPAIKGGRSVTATLRPPTTVGGPTFSLGTNTNATVIINSSTVATGTGLLASYYDTASATQTDAANFGQAGMYLFTRNSPTTTTGTIVISFTGGTIPGLAVGQSVKVNFTSGSLNSTTYNNFNYSVTAVTSSTLTLSITNAASFSGTTSTNGNCNFSIQSITHPPISKRVEPTINLDWQGGSPNGNAILPNNSADNYSSTWEAYLQPSTAGNYIFQLDADDKARVLLDTGSGLQQIVEHNWTNPGSDVVGTFKQSASIPLVIPASPAQRYKMRVEHVETTGDARCRLQWSVNGGGFANIPQANQYTHTQALSYIHSAPSSTVIVTPTNGHTFSVGDTVPLSFSSGYLLTPGAASTYSGNYTVVAVGGNSPTITITGAQTTVSNATVTIGSTTGLVAGMAVSGTGIPGNEYITAITSPTTFTVTTGTGVTAQTSTTLTITSNFTVSLRASGPYVALNGASTTAGSATVNVASTNGLVVGMEVFGTGFPSNEFITAIGSGTITVTTGTGVTALASTNLIAGTVSSRVLINGATTIASSPTITVPSTANLAVGMLVTGTGLPVNEFITAVGTTTITVTTGTGVTAQQTTNLTAASTGFAIPITGATTTANSPNLYVPSTNGLVSGMIVSGTGLPANELITGIITSVNGPGLMSVTTGTGVTTLASANLTAILPVSGTSSGSGFVLNVPTPPNTPSPQTGLYNLCYGNTGFSGAPGRVGVDGTVTASNNGIWNSGCPDSSVMQADTFSARFTGQVQPQFSETYTFTVVADDGCALWINGQPQTLKMMPSSVTGGSTYIYDSLTGNVLVNYSGLVVPSGAFSLGETVRCDFGSGNLNNAPTTACTYDYDPVAGVITVDYTNQTVGQSGGTRAAASYSIGDTVEISPSTGVLSRLGNLPYAITAVSGNTFSVAVPSGSLNFTPTIGISSISATSPCTVKTAQNHGLTTGTRIRISSVAGGTFSAPINDVYTITVTSQNTFTVDSNCSAVPTVGTGTLVALGNVTVNDSRNLPITKLYASGSTYTYTVGTGATVVNFSALSLPGTSFTQGSSVELAATGGPLVGIKSASYTITAVDTVNRTFTVTFPTNQTTPTGFSATTSINIAAPANGPIPASLTNAFTVNIGSGKHADLSSGSVNLDINTKAFKDWSSNGNERFVRIPMIGGVRYDIQLDHWENTGVARCILSWFSPSQPKQVVPQERLYPTSVAQAPPTHLAPTSASALANGPFSYTIDASNGSSVSISGNPAWLTLNGNVLSGTPPPGSGGDYQIIITITNGSGTSTSLLNLHVDQNAGSIGRESWDVAGTSVASIPTGTTPAGTSTLTSLEGPTNVGDNYGARIRGYLTAPSSGNYYFWLAANDAAELWISNDDEPVNAVKRAWITTGNATPRSWSDSITQKSAWLALEAGQKYYIEILHKAGVGSDYLAVGWLKPGETGSVPSEVVPGYALSPFTVLVPVDTGSSSYSSILRPQTVSTITNASGTSFIRLNAAGTSANVTVNYSGLSSGYFGMHIHDDMIPGGGLSNVIADFDQPNDIAKLADGSYQWVIQPRSSYSVADLVTHLKTGHLYFNVHSTMYTGGEIKGYYSVLDGSQTFTPPAAPPSWSDDSGTSDGAARFLSQATFGANPADIAALKALTPAGTTNSRYEKWINDQFQIAPTSHLQETQARELGDVFGSFDTKLSFDSWWKTSITGPDQLRQRVAFALSQVHVVSGQGPLEDNALALSHFYDTLAAKAFGNFRDVLIGTTLTPAMGRYLDMLRNDKPDLSVGRSPNENYAREIKQLFSIGLYRMWPDGTLVLDSQFTPVPTYTQREIVGLAHVFTGWDYGYDGDDHTSLSAATDWTRPMRAVPARHFTGPKRVLNNEVLPGLTTAAGQPLDAYGTHTSNQYYDTAYAALPTQELNTVHDMLFNHPNTGPFVCRQLIQRLVTSTPTKPYLYRVVQKFNDNGSGIRGDMQAVIKAILLDTEARSPAQFSVAGYGKQREPVMRVANAGRAFRPADVTGTYSQTGSNIITITTSTPHLLQASNSVFLEFVDGSTPTAQQTPSNGVYTVVTAPSTTSYTIAAPGWLACSYNQTAGSSNMTITTQSSATHSLPGVNANQLSLPPENRGQAYFKFISTGAVGVSPADGLRTTVTSSAYDTPSGVGNTDTVGTTAGSTNGSHSFTIPAPDTTARSGTVLIARFPGSYSCTGRNGIITIDTSFNGVGNLGQQANHGLYVGDTVFLNFTNSRDTTAGGTPSSTDNDIVYTIASVPDANSFTVAARDAANAAINSDNQVVIFPLSRTQPLTRNGSLSTRQGTYALDNTDYDLQQSPLNSPTVFNFYLPDYKFAGMLSSNGLTTPEFQLTSETSVIRQANFFYSGLFNPSNTTGMSGFYSTGSSNGTNSLAVPMDLSPWMANAVNTAGSIGYILGNGTLGTNQQVGEVWTSNANLPTLIDRLNTLLTGGRLPALAKARILAFVGGQIGSVTSGNPTSLSFSADHGLVVGDQVVVSGISGGTWSGASTTGNGTFFVTAVPSTTSVRLGTLATGGTALTCSNSTGVVLNNSTLSVSSLPYPNLSPTDSNKRDRLRTIIHFILTSPDFTIQR